MPLRDAAAWTDLVQSDRAAIRRHRGIRSSGLASHLNTGTEEDAGRPERRLVAN